jgi:hypothetical protein
VPRQVGICPASDPIGLLIRVRSAFINHDVNELTELFLWTGQRADDVQLRLDQLRLLTKRELSFAHVLHDTQEDEQGRERRRAVAIEVLLYQKKDRLDTDSVRFGIRREVDCFWLQ